MKSTVYLDTTIPSYLFDERESLKLHIDTTQKWWEAERENFDMGAFPKYDIVKAQSSCGFRRIL
jgi:hypothetical protein